MDKLDQLFGDKIEEKLVSLGKYAVQISPVESGAFVTSWSLRPIGSGGGRSRKPTGIEVADVQATKEEAKSLIEKDAATYKDQIIDRGGAVLTNRSPHARAVDARYNTIARAKDRFR
jgi:hypothetical protein